MRCLSDQRYNFLKANHNYSDNEQVIKLLFIRSKIQFFESKSQLWCWTIQKIICCLSDQRYNFLKANHNQRRLFLRRLTVVYQIKDTIFWKQITTFLVRKRTSLQLFIRSKIQFFESKSQLCLILCSRSVCCLSDQRYNFLKANHTRRLRVLP